MATHAVDVLEKATVHANLLEAIKDCAAAFALSARGREWSPQVLDVRTAAARATRDRRPGRVRLRQRDRRPDQRGDVRLPVPGAHPGQPGVQLAQPRAGGAGRGLRAAHGGSTWRSRSPRAEKLATVEDLEGLYAHLEEAAVTSGFMTPASRLRERWRRLFSRVPALEREEVNILRGLLKALLGKANS